MRMPLTDARTRLQAAALELFARDGFERVTAAQIATHAGVTERTFFRHFPDKREVLFDGEALVRTTLVEAIATAPRGLSPMDIMLSAFVAFAPLLESKRSYAEPRQHLIAATPALHERELAKIDALSAALADALKTRGIADLQASLAAQVGMAAFVQASHSWMNDPTGGLAAQIEQAFAELAKLVGPGN